MWVNPMTNYSTRRTALKVTGSLLGATAIGVGTAVGADGDNDDVPDSGNRAVGGGEKYNRKIPPSEADYMISEVENLRPVLEEEAESGDVVYIHPDATLVPTDLGYDYADNIPVPAGVTLASNRGINGAPGGHIHVDLVDGVAAWPVLDIEEDVRVTGLRVSGPQWEWTESDEIGRGIRALGPGTEIDNCEIWGFSGTAVGKGHSDFYGNFSLNVHNNYIHHNPRDGLGYGVESSQAAHDLIEYNLFEHNRHSIAGGGSGGYTARFNHDIGETAISHIFDMHRPGGARIHIHHNTIEPYDHAAVDRKARAVTIRGVPKDEAWIHHNWFHNPEPPRESPNNEWSQDEAITQMHVEEWSNVRFDKNHYGEDEPESSAIGAPSSHDDILDSMP